MMPEKYANLEGVKQSNEILVFELAGLFSQCSGQYLDGNKAKITVQLCKVWRVSHVS